MSEAQSFRQKTRHIPSHGDGQGDALLELVPEREQGVRDVRAVVVEKHGQLRPVRWG